MIVVDTSVWIDAHRRPTGHTAAALNELLDADEVALALPVRLELVAGVARKDRRALTLALTGLPLLRPSEETWTSIERWVMSTADKGERFGMADWLVAALASEISGLVWSMDDDFVRLERLGVVNSFSPRSARS